MEIRSSVSNLYQAQYAPSPVVNVSDQNEKYPDDDLFHHIYKKRRSSNENELDSFLGCPVVPAEINSLEWWKV